MSDNNMICEHGIEDPQRNGRADCCPFCRIAALEAKLAALLADVDEAMDYSGNRWSEWGTRAETVGNMLDAAILKARNG